MFDLKSYLAAKQILINNFLQETIKKTANSGRISEAMEYSLMAGGKRIRPVLCMAACEAVNGKYQYALPAACAIEMVHTYSLIHDDLPAMDDDILRRGKETSHVKYDEATAILAGDALLTLAFKTLSMAGLSETDGNTALKWLNIICFISRAAGSEGMIEGQMRDVASEKTILDFDQLEQIHQLKTGALIKASVLTGVILGKGTDEHLQQLKIYGENIGLAFQVADDILNVEGDPIVMGKSAGTDTAHGKNTYPSLMGLAESKKFANKLIARAMNSINSFGTRADPLRAIASYIIKRKQ